MPYMDLFSGPEMLIVYAPCDLYVIYIFSHSLCSMFSI
jgi:hypothetical protein